jgi:hypothetical protein
VEKPTFIGIRFASRALGCWHGNVEGQLGKPDAVLRFGVRDQNAWLQARIDNIIPRTESPTILYGRAEARRFIGISFRASFRILPDSIAVAFFPGFGKLNPLFLESQLSEIRRAIKGGSIKVQRRSLKAPVFQAYLSEPRHVLQNDLSVENQRIERLQELPKFWATNV